MTDKNKRKEKYSLQQNGSLTLESAVILPLFFLAAVLMSSMLDLFRIQTILITSLTESAEELGMYAYCAEGLQESPVGDVTGSACIAYSTARLRERLKQEPLTGIVGKKNGISLLLSTYGNGMVKLRADYLYRSPVQLLPLMPRHLFAVSWARAWVGYEGMENTGEDGEKEKMVYITDNESVYHLSLECSHLELDVKSAAASGAGSLRNDYGEKYQPCKKCWKAGGKPAVIYVSAQGDSYHGDSHCSGLTRHIKMIKQSDTQTNLCQRCKEKEAL